MRKCMDCGTNFNEQRTDCPYCHSKNVIWIEDPRKQKNDNRDFGMAFLSFLIPIVGIILYLVWKDDYPLKASSCINGAILSIVIAILLWLGYSCLTFSILGYL